MYIRLRLPPIFIHTSFKKGWLFVENQGRVLTDRPIEGRQRVQVSLVLENLTLCVAMFSPPSLFNSKTLGLATKEFFFTQSSGRIFYVDNPTSASLILYRTYYLSMLQT